MPPTILVIYQNTHFLLKSSWTENGKLLSQTDRTVNIVLDNNFLSFVVNISIDDERKWICCIHMMKYFIYRESWK